MDILVHRVEARLQREVLHQRIAGRQADLRGMIGLDDTRLTTSLQQRLLCREFAVMIKIHVTRTQRIEHRIAQSCRHRQFLCERVLIVDKRSTLQRLFTLQLICRDARLLTYRLILSALHIVVLHRETV